ncbi:MAG: hypothetical protein IPH62_19915 [Ignavibacteriae bacterium]|nr:hypothetical protein [Ignavibacteriota bacterium]
MVFSQSMIPKSISVFKMKMGRYKIVEKQELFLNDTVNYSEFVNTNTYANPVILSEEQNRLYLFWRGIDNKP